jgi:LPS sulfotransferase NodH
VIRRVLEHLGLPVPSELRYDKPRLTIQADELSESWVTRVHEHLEALEGPEPAGSLRAG